MAAPQNINEYWEFDIAVKERMAAALESMDVTLAALVVQSELTGSVLEIVKDDLESNLERIAVRADRGPFR